MANFQSLIPNSSFPTMKTLTGKIIRGKIIKAKGPLRMILPSMILPLLLCADCRELKIFKQPKN